MAKLAFNRLIQELDGNGDPYAGALLFTYAAGSSTKQTTYQDSAGSTAHQNPIVLDANGRIPAGVWLTEGQTYKFILAPSDDTDPPASSLWTLDNVAGINDASVALDQWSDSGLTATYISATQFSVAGDQTTDLEVGRRVKVVDSGGTKYGYITVSAYTTLTTVTVVLDSGSLANPISSLSIGVQTVTNPSEPLQTDDYPIRSGSADKTKKLRLELDGFTTGTTRVLTPPDADLTLPAVTAKGDVIAASASGVLVKVAVGTNGKPLVADSAQTAGVNFGNAIVLSTEQASTSDTTIDFTSIPSGVRRITIMLNEVSTNGTSAMIVQIGDSGGIESSGYISGAESGASYASSTSGFLVNTASVAAATYSGAITLVLEDASDFTWVAQSNINRNADSIIVGVGRKATSAELDRVRITMVNGTDAFDSGAINISYEF